MKTNDGVKIRANHIEEKVFSYMEKHGMAVSGDNIVVGCSGGADSVCLLFLLLEYSRRTPVNLKAVHVDHGIRPDSGEDAGYVESLCAGLGIPFCLIRADVRAFAAREKCSEEDAGRRIRYEAFGRAAEEMGGAKIAVAHNADDNAETVLLHLFRGSGLRGVCGIAPVRDGIIRPLLCLGRDEVEAYLDAGRVVWRQDSTNAGDDYLRNRIRHHVLPYVEERIAPGAVGRMCKTAEILSETEDYLARQTKEALDRCASGGAERYELDVKRFLEFHRALQKRMLLALAERLSPTGRDISAVHVEEVLSLFEKPGNRDICLPYGVRAGRRYGVVALERAADGERPGIPGRGNVSGAHVDGEDFCVETPLPETGQPVEIRLPDGGLMRFCKRIYGIGQEVPRNQCTKWLDYDKITEYPAVRFRKSGDYLTIADGNGGWVRKTLKEYMIEAKIPRELRGRIPLIAVGSHVLWLTGYRISESVKISGDTKYILQAELKRDGCGSGTEEKNVGTC